LANVLIFALVSFIFGGLPANYDAIIGLIVKMDFAGTVTFNINSCIPDAIAGARLYHLRAWWDHLVDIGPEYGYHPNTSKTWLIVKEDLHDAATATFQGTDVNITVEGKRQLGAALGTRSFAEEYVRRKVASWVDEIERLSSIALTQPHAAYAAYTHGLMSKWTFLARTAADIGDLFKPLEGAIRH